MVLALWSYLLGYVIIMVTGPGLEKFLNLASQRRITLWNIKRLKADVLIASVRIGGFKHLRPLARRSGSQIKIVRKRGLPFFGKALRQRWALSLGAVLCLGTLYLLAGQIWFIQLEDCPKKLEGAVKKQLAASGLVIGARRHELDPKKLADELLAKNEQITWATVQFHGTLAKVRIVPKKTAKAPKNTPSHLVATRDAELIHLIVYSGQALAAPGEMVHRGQIIVSGQVLHGPDEANPLVRDTGREFVEPKIENLRASAFIEGKFWLEGYGEAKEGQIQKEKLESRLLRQELYLGKVRLGARKRGAKKPGMRLERKERIIQKKLGLKVVNHWGILEKETKLDPQKLAYSKAQEEIRRQLNAGEKIQHLKPIVLREGDLVRVKILAECKGPVAVEKPFQPGDGEGIKKLEEEHGSEHRAESST